MADTEKTKAQNGTGVGMWGTLTSWMGGSWPWKASTGVTIQPPSAALIGSGSFDQTNAYSAVVPGLTGLYGIGGIGNVPGFGPLPGTFQNYRIILRHPTCVLARAAVFGPVLASPWMYEAHTTKAPKEAKDLLVDYFEPIRLELMVQVLRCLDFGFQAFEIVWGENADGYRVPVKLKPLLPEITQARVDANGNYIGLTNNGVDLDAAQTLWITYNGEAGDPYGSGRVENIRRAWANWLVTDDQAFRLGDKASGIYPVVYFPPDKRVVERGDSTANQTGTVQSNYDKAINVGLGLQRGRPIVIKNYSALGGIQDPEAAAKLADKSDWVIKTIDMGNTGPAQLSLDTRQRYLDALICRGWHRSERSVIEAQTAGSRADSETMTASIGDTDSDIINGLMLAAINRQLTDRILEENFGPKAKGTARAKAREIVDEKRATMNTFTAAVFADPLARGEVFNRTDMDAWMEYTGLKQREDAEPFDDIPTAAEQFEQTQQAASQKHDDDADAEKD